MKFAKCFGENVNRYRRRSNLTQEELSSLAGLHRNAVGEIERGERIVRADTLVRIACSLEVKPERLLSGIRWIPAAVQRGELIVGDEK